MEQFKITYNYKESSSYETTDHWLVGCEVVEAEDYLDAQKKFEAKYPGLVIRDIELLG